MLFKKPIFAQKLSNPVSKKEVNLHSNLANTSNPLSNFNQFSPPNIYSAHDLKNFYGLDFENDQCIDHIISSNIRVSFSNTNFINKKEE